MTLKKFVIRPDGSKEVADSIVKRCKEEPERYYSQIRRLARYEDLIARKSRKDGKWYFSDHTNSLKSSVQGLDDLEALKYLLEK
jgi:hypothetical protein